MHVGVSLTRHCGRLVMAFTSRHSRRWALIMMAIESEERVFENCAGNESILDI